MNQPVRNHATLFLLGAALLLAGTIAFVWFWGQGYMGEISQQIAVMEANPPMWMQAPKWVWHYFLFWTVSLMVGVWAIIKLSPRPQTWSRWLIIGILLALTTRYLYWRASTLNLSTTLNGIFSIGLFGLELIPLTAGLIQLVLLLKVKDRRPEADQLCQAVIQGAYTPTVDILIPTYNEPAFILRRTIIGCQALDYPHKTIYLLDDTRRPEMQALAQELGCEYKTRPDNRNAKAGNLNYTIPQIEGELIIVFDADFIPTKNFLTRTVGFFQDPQIALVQTPQTFYSPDPIAYNLGLEEELTPEEEVFYRQIQPFRDAAGGVICAGTSFVVRRSALVETGCFFTKSLSEDYFTGIQLAAKGYRLVYLNEKLSAGLAAESIAAQALQRVRWAQGTLQAFFVKANPFTIRGLRPIQRLAHLEGILHWFSSITRLAFLLVPLAYAFLGVIPIRASLSEVMHYFVPYFLVQLMTTSWLNYRARSALLADLYGLILVFPLAMTAIRAIFRPFSQGFRVTPKGGTSSKFVFNWQLAYPLILTFMATALGFWVNLGMTTMYGMMDDNPAAGAIPDALKGLNLGVIFSLYNLLILAVSVLILFDAPRLSPYEWFKLRRTVRLQVGEQVWWGSTELLSEIGAEVVLTQRHFVTGWELANLPVQLTLMEEDLELEGTMQPYVLKNDGLPRLQITFAPLSLDQHRRLVEALFCRPGQWRSRCAPGELKSLWLLVKCLLRPRVIFNAKPGLSGVSVLQG
jgi:cellulose synthase (UDP-forming)